MHFSAQIKVAIAILISLVLDVLRAEIRQLGKSASTINQAIVAKPQDIAQYETNLEAHVFSRIQAVINDTAGEVGYLGDMLRDGCKSLPSILVLMDLLNFTLESSLKSKGNEDSRSSFVSTILNDVL